MKHCGVWSLHAGECRWCPRCGAVWFYLSKGWAVPDPSHDGRKEQPDGPAAQLARAQGGFCVGPDWGRS